MGFAWSVPVSSKENNRAKTNGGWGERYHRWGVQNRFWEGVVWYVFPSPEFSIPLCFSLKKGEEQKRRPKSVVLFLWPKIALFPQFY